MINLQGKIIEKATMPDESAVITVEFNDSSRFDFKVERKDARTGYDIGELVNVTVEEVKTELPTTVGSALEPSSETLALMGEDENVGVKPENNVKDEKKDANASDKHKSIRRENAQN